MAITAVLMLALATFSNAVSRGWQNSQDQYKARSVSHQSVAQLRDALSDMLCVVQTKVGDTTGGSAYLFCWDDDDWGGAADRKAQFGEMALIEYDPVTKAIWLYQTKDASAMTAAEKTTAGDEDWGDYSATSIVTYFKSSSMVKPRTPLVGGATGDGGASVTSAMFGYFAATNGKPVATYQLSLATAGTGEAASDNVALRAAQTPTNLTFESVN